MSAELSDREMKALLWLASRNNRGRRPADSALRALKTKGAAFQRDVYLQGEWVSSWGLTREGLRIRKLRLRRRA